ncbi:MAG: SH3 domain-containing protein [Lachnospiraceae bacterium]|nr:SH3 domain-containing protein [Lachnospiraceae bacterium]
MRIKKITKAIICMSLALSIVCGQYIPVSAQERSDWKYERVSDETVPATIVVEKNADYEIVLVITGVDKESGDAYGHFSVRSDGTPGFVNGDGVRLRSKPSLSSTTLEYMYSNEEVTIHSGSNNADGDWYYITREKTKTKGYVYALYVIPYPNC